MRGLGRHRSALCHAVRRPEVLQAKQNVGVGAQSEINSDREETRMKRKGMWIAGMAATGGVSLGLLLAGSPKVAANTQQAATEVKIDNFSFGPVALTVPVGTTVTWINRDDIPHNAVSTDDPKIFKSKVLDTV